MIKRIAEFFYKDFGWKLLSLLAALVLWFVGINMNNPMQNHTVRQRVQLNNLEILANEGLLLLNEAELRDTLIQVGVRAQRNEIDFLRSAELADSALFNEMINISIDFRAIPSEYVHSAEDAVTLRLDISPNLYHGLEHFSIRPSYVEVHLDAISRNTFPVDVIRHGEAAVDSWLHSITLANNRVTVSGPRTVIREIESIQANVDVTGLYGYTEQSAELRAFNFDGDDITEHVSLSVTSTAASISVWPVRQLPINVEFIGDVASGFAVYGFTVDPEFVSVASSTFEGIDEFTVYVDLMSAEETTFKTINLADNLPQGMALVHYDRPNVFVQIIVEPIAMLTLNVPSENLRWANVPAGFRKLNERATYPITVRGPRSLMDNLSARDIFLDYSLAGLSVGTYNITLNVSVPDGITVVSPPPDILIEIYSPAVAVEESVPPLIEVEEPEENDVDDIVENGDVNY